MLTCKSLYVTASNGKVSVNIDRVGKPGYVLDAEYVVPADVIPVVHSTFMDYRKAVAYFLTRYGARNNAAFVNDQGSFKCIINPSLDEPAFSTSCVLICNMSDADLHLPETVAHLGKAQERDLHWGNQSIVCLCEDRENVVIYIR